MSDFSDLRMYKPNQNLNREIYQTPPHHSQPIYQITFRYILITLLCIIPDLQARVLAIPAYGFKPICCKWL